MLEELKKEVLRVSRLAEDSQLCQHGGGNFSMMDREKGLIAITPHAESRYAITDDDIIIVNTEGEIIENIGNLTPSSETVVHLEVLNNRKDINAVAHTHARNAATFAVLNKEIKPILCEALFYGGVCRVAPFEVPGTIEFARSVVKGLEGTYAAVLEKHGLVTIGENIYDAYLKTLYVEEVGGILLQAAAIVGYDNVEAIPDDMLDYLQNVAHIVG